MSDHNHFILKKMFFPSIYNIQYNSFIMRMDIMNFSDHKYVFLLKIIILNVYYNHMEYNLLNLFKISF